MRQSEQGFSHVFILLVAVLLVASSGYVVYVHQHDKAPTVTSASNGTHSGSLSAPANEPKTAAGSAAAVDNLASSLVNNEDSLNSQYTANDSTSDGNVGAAANNLGGAYDANNY